MVFFLSDNGGRRSGIDRRQFSYSGHIPEKRFGQDRRKGKDRRKDIPFNIKKNRRSGIGRGVAFA